MAQVLIRNIDEQTLGALKRRAAERGVSLQQELKSILETAAGRSSIDSAEIARRIRERFEQVGIPFSDSTELVREDRER